MGESSNWSNSFPAFVATHTCEYGIFLIIKAILAILTNKRNGVDITLPIARPSLKEMDDKHPSLSKKKPQPMVHMNPPAFNGISRKSNEPVVELSNFLNMDDTAERVEPVFFENFRRKSYSCKSLDLDSDFDVSQIRVNNSSADHKVDAMAVHDGLDRLFMNKEIKSFNSMSLRDISSWSLWKTDLGFIRESLNEEEKVIHSSVNEFNFVDSTNLLFYKMLCIFFYQGNIRRYDQQVKWRSNI